MCMFLCVIFVCSVLLLQFVLGFSLFFFSLPFLPCCAAGRVFVLLQVSVLCIRGGRAESRTLDHQRPPGAM